MSREGKSFFHSLPGVLTGLASLIAAITGLYVAVSGHSAKEEQAEPYIIELPATYSGEPTFTDEVIAPPTSPKVTATPNQPTQPQVFQANISGNWLLTNPMGTYTFVIWQDGNHLTVQEFDPMGNVVGQGTGSIHRRSVNINLIEAMLFTQLSFQLRLELSQDGQRLSGQIIGQGSSTAATLYKQ